MDTVIRVAVIYVFLMVAFRIIGKREFGQLEPFEFVTLILIPHLVADAMTGDDYSVTNALIAVSTVLTLVFLTSLLAFLSRPFARVVEGEAAVLVRHGYLVPENMNKERIAPAELTAEMHRFGLEWMSQVKWAVLETDGKITFVPWRPDDNPVRMEKKEIA